VLRKTLTPTRQGVIRALRIFDRAKVPSIPQIADLIQVPKPTGQDVCKHAITNSLEKREKEKLALYDIPQDARDGDLVAIDNVLEDIDNTLSKFVAYSLLFG
jgi:hypothetical protein